MSRRASTIGGADAAIQTGIEARLYLNEERAFIPLCKAVYALINSPDDEESFANSMKALDAFIQVEVEPSLAQVASATAQVRDISLRLRTATGAGETALADSQRVTGRLEQAEQTKELRESANEVAVEVNRKFVDEAALENLNSSVEDLRDSADARAAQTQSRKRKIDLVARLAKQIKT